MFSGIIGMKNGIDVNINYLEDSGQRENINRYMGGGYGTYNKRPLDDQELYELPRFVGSLRNKMDLRRKGREVGRDLSPNATF